MQAPAGYTENFDHFISRHTDPKLLPPHAPPRAIPVGQVGSHFAERTYILPDGAGYSLNSQGARSTFEPRDQRQQLENRIEYLTIRRDRAELAFPKLKAAILCESDKTATPVSFSWGTEETAEFGPQPQQGSGRPRGESGLLLLKLLAFGYRDFLKGVEAKHAKLSEVILEKRQERAAAAYKQTRERQSSEQHYRERAEIQKIEL